MGFGKWIDCFKGLLGRSDSAWLSYRKALKHFHASDFAEAIAFIDNAILINPQDAQAYLYRGLINFLHLKDEPKGLTDFKRALELDPASPTLHAQFESLKYKVRSLYPDLVKQLSHYNSTVRRLCAWSLGNIGGDENVVVPAVGRLLKDNDDDVRRAAAWTLQEFGSKEAVPFLTEAMSDKNKNVRSLAIMAFEKIKSPACVNGLIKGLTDSDSHTRANSARTLKEIGAGARAAVPTLINALNDSDDWVVSCALDALKEIGVDLNPAVPQLLKLLKRKGKNHSRDAAEVLEIIGPVVPEIIPALIEALKDDRCAQPSERKDDIVDNLGLHRSALSNALGAMGADAVPHLIQCLADLEVKENDRMEVIFDKSLRASVLKALEKVGIKAIPSLREALKSNDNKIRGNAASALGLLNKDALDVVSDLNVLIEKEKNDAVVKAAIVALGEILGKDQEGRQTIEPNVENSKARSYRSVLITTKSFPKEVYGPLFSFADSKNVDIRIALLRSLESAGITESHDIVLSALKDNSPQVRKYAVKAIPKFQQMADVEKLINLRNDSDEQVRSAVVDALAWSKSDEALQAITSALADQSKVVQDRAVYALEALRNEKAVVALAEYNNRTKVPLLRKQLFTVDGKYPQYDRERAAKELGELGAREAIPDLIKVLFDDHSDAREKAEEALCQLGPAEPKDIDCLIQLLNPEEAEKGIKRSAADLNELARIYEMLGLSGGADRQSLVTYLGVSEINRIRGQVCRILGAWKIDRALPILISLIPEIGAPAIKAVGCYGARASSAVKILIDGLVDDSYDNPCYGALVNIGDSAVPELVRSLSDPKFRSKSTSILASIDSRLSKEALKDHLKLIVSDLDSISSRSLEQIAWALKGLGLEAEYAFEPLLKAVKYKSIDEHGGSHLTVSDALLAIRGEKANEVVIDLLAKALVAKSKYTRDEAVEKLEAIGSERAQILVRSSEVERIIADLNASRGELSISEERDRFEAADKLRRIGTPEAQAALESFAHEYLSVLINRLESNQIGKGAFEYNTIEALGCLGKFASQATELLIAQLAKESEAEAQCRVMVSLVKIGSDKSLKVAIDGLLTHLRDGSTYFADTLAEAHQKDSRVIPALIDSLGVEQGKCEATSSYRPIRDALASLGHTVLDALVTAYRGPDQAIREGVVEVWAAMGNLVVEHLVKFLRTDPPLKNGAAYALMKIANLNQSNRKLLLKVVRESDSFSAQIAAVVLLRQDSISFPEELGNDAEYVLNALSDALSSSDATITCAVMEGLGRTSKPILIDKAVQFLSQNDIIVKVQAIRLVANHRVASSLPELQKSLNDDHLVALEAAIALSQIGTPESRRAFNEFALSKLDSIIEDLRSTDSSVRNTALRFMREMGPEGEKAFDALVELIRDDHNTSKFNAVECIMAVSPSRGRKVLEEIKDDLNSWSDRHFISQIDKVLEEATI